MSFDEIRDTRSRVSLCCAGKRFDQFPARATASTEPACASDMSAADAPAPHIRNTPNRVSGIGALRAAEKASASTRRVSCGVMMPSSHSRAVA